jgi:hypothetical protein
MPHLIFTPQVIQAQNGSVMAQRTAPVADPEQEISLAKDHMYTGVTRQVRTCSQSVAGDAL